MVIPKLTWDYNPYLSIVFFTMLRSFIANWRPRKTIPAAIAATTAFPIIPAQLLAAYCTRSCSRMEDAGAAEGETASSAA